MDPGILWDDIMIKKIFLAVIFSIFTFYFSLTAVFAAEDPSTPSTHSINTQGRTEWNRSTTGSGQASSGQDFATSYDVTYDIDLSGITSVTEKITLRNLTSQYFASQFKLIIGATQITDIKASDQGGLMEVTSEQKDTSTSITVKFNQQIAGVGKEQPFTLSFKSSDFAQHLGKIWEISAPKIQSAPGLQSYNLTISTPQSFGPPSIISPTPKRQSTSSGRTFLIFDKDQLILSGVSATFGSFQVYDFNLTYNLENPNLVPVLTNIALPPDTAYQEVIYQRIEPKPINVTLDEDGNYLAWYKLKRAQKLSVKATGSAKLYILTKVKNPVLPTGLYQKYTTTQKYWEKDHPTVKSKLSEILSTNQPSSTEQKVKLIYQSVISTLQYDTSRLSNENIERLGAVTALNNPNSAVCMEFTDLFISLTRAAGIPARELDGFAYTTNLALRPLSLSRDILHAWPEYWDDNRGWVMVDPTWQNTTGGVDYFNKLDLNHFVFVIKGSSSEQPVPAGSYKLSGMDSHDVKVELSQSDFLGKPQPNLIIDVKKQILAGFPHKINIKIENLGNAALPSSNLSVNAGQVNILNGAAVQSGPIPSFGFAQFEFELRTKSLLDSFDDVIEIQVAGIKERHEIKVRPFFILQNFPWIALGLVAVVAVLYFAILGTLIYRRRFAKPASNK